MGEGEEEYRGTFFLWRLRGIISKEGAGGQQIDTTLRELPIVFILFVGQFNGLCVHNSF